MRLRTFLLICAIVAWFGCDGVRAQSTKVAPDCVLPFSVTVAQAAGAGVRKPTAGFSNKVNGTTLPCTTWALNYQAPVLVTALTVELDSAPDSAGVAGTWGAFAGTVVQNVANPTSTIPNDFLVRQGSPAWVSVKLSGATGSGTITGAIYGWIVPPVGLSSVTFSPSGTQDVNIKTVGGVAVPDSSVPTLSMCPLSAVFNTSSSGNVQIVAASGSTVVYICEISFAANAASDIKLTTGTGAACGTGTADLTGLYKSVSAVTLDPLGALRGPAGSAICINQSVANTLGGTISFAQF